MPVQIFRDDEDPRAMHYADCKAEWLQAIAEEVPDMPEVEDIEFKFMVASGEFGIDMFDVTPLRSPSFPFWSPTPGAASRSPLRRLLRRIRHLFEAVPKALMEIEKRL